MPRRPLRRLPLLARNVYSRARAGARAAGERFSPRLRFDAAALELLLSPHWDDAVLDCWGLLSSERRLQVVNVFAGIPTSARAGLWEAVIGAHDPEERARARMAEDARALAAAGREPLNLPLLDVSYRREGSYEVGLEELDRALSEQVPSASRVYVPAGIGANRDHLLTRRYGRALLHAGVPVSMYAELPYCTFHGWPPWVDGNAPSPRRNVDAYWESFLGGVPEMPPLRAAEVVRLDAATATAKRAALESYETSLSYAFRRMLADPAFHAFEVRWELIGAPGRPVALQEPVRSAAG